MNFPSKGFLIALSAVLLLGVVALTYVVYQEAHVIVIQKRLILDMWQFIVQGCPTDQ